MAKKPEQTNQYTDPDPRQDLNLRKISGIQKNKYCIRTSQYIKNNPGYIYAIKIGDYLKIGKAYNFERRLKDYLSIPPFECEVLMVDYVQDASFYERHFQSIFKEYQVKGEWFYIGDVDRYHEYVVDNYKYLLKQIEEAYYVTGET